MNLKLIINNILNENNYSKDQLYLLTTYSEHCGFLYSGDRVYFAVKHIGNNSDSISTKYLTLQNNVYIGTIESSPSFMPDYYDLLIYTGDIDDECFDTFVELCENYINSKQTNSFNDFFYLLLDLFETEKETSFTNLIGAFGELWFIKMMFEKYKILLSKNWHNTINSYDKYDFVFKDFNLDIKTTVKEDMQFIIHHSQIFNNKNNYLLVINISQDNSGETITELFDYFINEKCFNEDLSFMIKLQKEKLKINNKKYIDKKFSCNQFHLFFNNDLDTIGNIPKCITNIYYTYDFSGFANIQFDKFIDKILNQ